MIQVISTYLKSHIKYKKQNTYTFQLTGPEKYLLLID